MIVLVGCPDCELPGENCATCQGEGSVEQCELCECFPCECHRAHAAPTHIPGSSTELN